MTQTTNHSPRMHGRAGAQRLHARVRDPQSPRSCSRHRRLAQGRLRAAAGRADPRRAHQSAERAAADQSQRSGEGHRRARGARSRQGDRRRRDLHVLDVRRHRARQLHPRAPGRHGRVPSEESSRSARCRTTSTCTASPGRAAARPRASPRPATSRSSRSRRSTRACTSITARPRRSACTSRTACTA